MVKKAICGAAVVALILCVGALPGWMLERTQQFPAAAVGQRVYRPYISAAGTLEAGERYELVLASLCCVEKTYAALGDRVSAGQVLAELGPISGSVYCVAGGSTPQLSGEMAALAASYGLDAAALLGQAQPAAAVTVGESTLVRAPVDGVLLSDLLPAGSAAAAGTALCTLQRADSLLAAVTVPEERVGELSPGCEAVLTLPGRTTPLTGTVSRIHPAAETTLAGTSVNTTVRVEISLSSPPDDLRAGGTLSAVIYTDASRPVLTVPYEAVLQQGGSEYVWLAENGVLVRREIITGKEFSDYVTVEDGLSDGETVLLLDGSDPEAGRPFLLKAGRGND